MFLQNKSTTSQSFLSGLAVLVRKKELMILCFVLIVTFLSFYPSLFGQFTNWDDWQLILENPEIRGLDWDHIKTIFTSTASLGYVPLSVFSFAIEHYFFGLNPFVIHLDNVLLHLVVTALVFFFGLRLKFDVWASGLAALLFGIHPMHVESVAWMAERKDVLYAMFYMLAAHSYWTYLNNQRKSSYVLAIFYGLLSMLAKPMALSLPLILLILDWMKGRRWTLNLLLEKIPYFLYILPLLFITYRIHAEPIHNPPMEAALTWIWCSVFYIWKFFFPFPVVPLYTLPVPVALGNPYYVAAIFGVILFILIIIRFRAFRPLMFAVLFYFLSIFFLFRFDTFNLNVVADRYMYLPSVGFCFLFGLFVHQGLMRLEKDKRLQMLAILCLAILFGTLSFKTLTQCKVWKDSLTLWTEMIRHNPNSAFAFYHRAKVYDAQGKYDLAEADYSQAIAYNSDALLAFNNRGIARMKLGRKDEALMDYNHSLEMNPEYADGYNNRGFFYYGEGQDDLALADFNKALKLDPNSLKAYGNRARVYVRLKQLDLARKDFDSAIKINSSVGGLYYYRSMVYADMKQFDKAIADARQAQALGYPHMNDYMNQLRKNAFSK